jgi:hypothetical protein
MIGRIYRIIHTESDLCYIGSTTTELRFRWQHHRSGYKRWINGKSNSCSIYHKFKEHGVDKFRMLLIKEYEVEDRKHLLAYEQLWINQFKKTAVNKKETIKLVNVSNTYSPEKYQANKASITAAKKRYYQKNREKILAKQKAYDQNHREKISEKSKEIL